MDRWVSVALMLAGVAGALRPPWRLPQWAVPVTCAVVALVGGVTTGTAAVSALHPLVQPVAFLLSAVPLAVMLDELGFFQAVSARLTARGGGPGSLWVLAAVVTTVLNLDAGVVLLTPLYVRIARQRGWDPLFLAAQPVLLACLASSALPVSNLTNLIAVSWAGATTTQFVAHLALPSLAACIVGWFAYRARFVRAATNGPEPDAGAPAQAERTDIDGERAGLDTDFQGLAGHGGARPGPAAIERGGARRGTGASPATAEAVIEQPVPDVTPAQPAAADAGSERTALRLGGGLVVCVLAGFVAGPFVGVSPWVVAVAADAVLAGEAWWRTLRQDGGAAWASPPRAVPWRSVPLGTAVMVFALGVLATAVAGHLPTGALFRGGSVTDLARDTGVAALGANVVNNLPALLVALPKLGHHSSPALWAVLLGVNMGPVVLVTGSLASLLWMSALRRLGVEVSARDFTRFGLVAGLPAAACALAVSLGLRAAGLY